MEDNDLSTIGFHEITKDIQLYLYDFFQHLQE